MGDEGGEAGPGQKMWNAFGLMCVGIVCLPIALYLLGSNEQNYMCSHKNIIFADNKAKMIPCNHEDLEDGVAYMSCPIKEESLETFTATTFGSSGLAGHIHFRSSMGAQKSEMFQCVESYHTEKVGNSSVKVYDYQMKWVSSPVYSNRFAMTPQAIQAREYGCPGAANGNPQWPPNLASGLESRYAQEIRAGPLTVDKKLMSGGWAGGLSINMANPINLNQFKGAFKALADLPYPNIVQARAPPTHTANNWFTSTVHQPPHPMHHGMHHGRRLFTWNQLQQMNPFGHMQTLDLSSISAANTAVDATGTYLVTCQQPRLGCIRIQYFKNYDTVVTLISGVQGGRTLPVDVPASWGCGSGTFDALVGGQMSQNAFTQMLEDNNTDTTVTVRVLGLLFAWMAVYCFFQPISASMDVIGDCVRNIPCLGPILEQMLEGVMTCMLCVISCGCGCSCGLFVIAVVWLYMRPLIGGGLLALCGALAAAAYYLGANNKQGKEGSRGLGIQELAGLTSNEGNEAGA